MLEVLAAHERAPGPKRQRPDGASLHSRQRPYGHPDTGPTAPEQPPDSGTAPGLLRAESIIPDDSPGRP